LHIRVLVIHVRILSVSLDNVVESFGDDITKDVNSREFNFSIR